MEITKPPCAFPKSEWWILISLLEMADRISVKITVLIDDEVLRRASLRAQAMGKSVNQLVREYIERLAGSPDREAIVAEFRELSKKSLGDSKGWKFNREELYDRKVLKRD